MKKINIDSEISALVLENKTVKEMSVVLKVCENTIWKSIKKNKLSYTNRTNRKWTLKDPYYFKNINTEQKAYILGILMADGYNNEKEGKIIISLLKQDQDILHKIAKDIYLDDYKIYNRLNNFGNQISVLQISSRDLSKDLASLGCIQAKSLILSFPKLENSFIPHFIRGYMDGDGSINWRKEDYNGSLSFIGSITFISELLMLLQARFKFTSKLTHKSGTDSRCASFQVSGNRQILEILDWIYKDSSLCLDRKYNKYLILKNVVENRKNNPIKRGIDGRFKRKSCS